MFRHNTQTNRFEGFQAGSWTDFLTGDAVPAGSNTQIQFNNNGALASSADLTWDGATFAVVGDMTYTGAIHDVSDRRLKDNIEPLGNRGSMLDRLAALNTYSFTMQAKPDQTEYGVIAQELYEVFPELVQADERTPEHYLAVNYLGLVAPIIEANKELKVRHDALTREVSQLKARLAALEATVPGAFDSSYVTALVEKHDLLTQQNTLLEAEVARYREVLPQLIVEVDALKRATGYPVSDRESAATANGRLLAVLALAASLFLFLLLIWIAHRQHVRGGPNDPI